MTERIAQVVVGLPLEGPFDYFIPEELAGKVSVGGRVLISFGPRRVVGYVVGLKAKSNFPKLKSLMAVIDQAPVLSIRLLQLAREAAGHYGCSWGEAIEASLPAFLRRPKPVGFSLPVQTQPAEQASQEVILVHDPGQKERWPFLLERIGKTRSLRQGVIILAPEISQLEEIHAVLKEKISEEICIFGKKSNSKKEREDWIALKEGKISIVLGSRSAVFAPVADVGLIIVFDEDNYAYKQEQSPYYHSRDVALMRARVEHCSLIFASATPSSEIYQLALKKKITMVSYAASPSAGVQIVDMSHYPFKKSSILSFPLRSGIQKALETGGKAVLFMNRKGFSTLTRCGKCGFTLKCKRCDTNLTYLYDQKKMVCRFCNYSAKIPNICPQCSSAYLRFSGMGIEKLQSEIARFFPQARVSHFDKDSASVKEGANVIIATQAILKMQGKVFPSIVGVVQADSELNRFDFRSGERTFSLLVHLRNLAKEKLIIQTSLPDNYCFQAVAKMDFKKFYSKELKTRREIKLPPFSHLVSVMFRAVKADTLAEQAQCFYQSLNDHNKSKQIEILDPQPDVVPKLRDKYRYTILVKGKSVGLIMLLIRKTLKNFRKKSGMIIAVNVDV